MLVPPALPPNLPDAFCVADALNAGISRGRLRRADLVAPYHGVRVRRRAAANLTRTDFTPASGRKQARLKQVEHNQTVQPDADRGERMPDHTEHARHLSHAHAYAPRLRKWQFFSHGTAALLWGAPAPPPLNIHVGACYPLRAPRTRGVIGHELAIDDAAVTDLDGLAVTSPATTWALLGDLTEDDLVIAGDYFIRNRQVGRRPNDTGPPLATIEELESAVAAHRRRGAAKLRSALKLVRPDSWSPTETKARLVLGRGGLPEPALNADIVDGGRFLACADLSYPQYKIAVEYHGQHHAAQYAHDVERIARLRAAGWIVIEVTWPLLFQRPHDLVERVRAALHQRGWTPGR